MIVSDREDMVIRISINGEEVMIAMVTIQKEEEVEEVAKSVEEVMMEDTQILLRILLDAIVSFFKV
jgi:hypothetical protein